MIGDDLLVTTATMEKIPAMEVYVGRDLMSLLGNRARVTEKAVAYAESVVLALSGGMSFRGSDFQRVRVFREKMMGFARLCDIKIGDKLACDIDGVRTAVQVQGIMKSDEKIRMVTIKTERDRPFIAESVVCRS